MKLISPKSPKRADSDSESGFDQRIQFCRKASISKMKNFFFKNENSRFYSSLNCQPYKKNNLAMVVAGQVVEKWTVMPKVASSNPIIFSLFFPPKSTSKISTCKRILFSKIGPQNYKKAKKYALIESSTNARASFRPLTLRFLAIRRNGVCSMGTETNTGQQSTRYS